MTGAICAPDCPGQWGRHHQFSCPVTVETDGGKVLVRHNCSSPTEPPANPNNSARWICPGCGLLWVWNPPIEPIPRTESYGFLGRKKRPLKQESWPGRWTYNPAYAVYVPEDEA